MFSYEIYEFFRTVTGGVLRKELFLNILQYSQESCRAATLLKKDFNTGVFEEHLLMAASDFLKQLQNAREQLLLY